MPNDRDHPLARLVRRIHAQAGAGTVADGQLLARFLVHQDADAFAALVRRHGPMVLAACRRILRDPNDADDAFQATFLVLVRKAGSIGKPDLLGNWLYGVASRIAQKTRATARRRRDIEDRSVPLPASSTLDLITAGELRSVLDEELNRLPDRYRAPIVLCYLEGKTHQEAANLVGCSRETLTTRLVRARHKLRQRLTRRGLAVSTAALAGVLAEAGTATAIAPTMTLATTQAATLLAAGKATTALGLSAHVVALLEGAVHAMFMAKVKTAAALVLTVGLLGAGATAVTYRSQAQTPAEEKQVNQEERAQLQPTIAPAKEHLVRVPSPQDGLVASIGKVISGNLSAGRVVQLSEPTKAAEGKTYKIIPAGDGRHVRVIEGGKTTETAVAVSISVGNEGRISFTVDHPNGVSGEPRRRVLRVGDRIEEGEVLATLDDSLARMDVDIKLSKLRASRNNHIVAVKSRDEAKLRWETTEKLRGRGGNLAAPDEEVRGSKLTYEKYMSEAESREFEIDTAKWEVERSKLLLRFHEIRSPVRGVIKDILKQKGEAVKAGETVFLIQVLPEKE